MEMFGWRTCKARALCDAKMGEIILVCLPDGYHIERDIQEQKKEIKNAKNLP